MSNKRNTCKHSENLLNLIISDEILQASDDLNHVSEKYKTVIVDGIPIGNKTTNDSLLDLDGIDLHVNTDLSVAAAAAAATTENKEIDVLYDVFNTVNISEQSKTDFLLPLAAQPENKTTEKAKSKALEELDVLSEHLLKENLQSSKKLDQQFNK